jgi:hypothetical protein
MPLIFIILIVVIVVAAGIGFAVREHQHLKSSRRRELAGWAEANGLKFHPDYDYSIGFRYQPFQWLQEGDNRYAYNIMVGTSGQWVTCGFDYHYQIHPANGKGLRRTHHHHFSAVVMDAGFPLKPLFIRPGRFFDKAAEFVGFEGLGFESAEFSRKFCVKSPDRRWAYDVLHQKTLEMMLDYPRFHIDIHGTQVAACSGHTEFTPEEFALALKLVTGILDNLPDAVVRELKGIDSGGVLS